MPKSANPFANAKVIAAVKSTKKDDKKKVQIDGLNTLANIDAVMKALKAMRDTVEVDIKTAQKDYFVAEAVRTGTRPDNFRGIDGNASASCELRTRGTNSPLNPEEVKLCKEYGLPTATETSVQETFIINPEYLGNGALLERVGAAIAKVKDIPEDFIKKQEAVSKTVVDAKALEVLCATKDANKISTLLGVVGVLALKVGGDVDMANALKTVAGLLNTKESDTTANTAAA